MPNDSYDREKLCCPNCTSSERLQTIETVASFSDATFHVEEDSGGHHFYAIGSRLPQWDTAVTQGVRCQDCLWAYYGEDYLDQLVPASEFEEEDPEE